MEFLKNGYNISYGITNSIGPIFDLHLTGYINIDLLTWEGKTILTQHGCTALTSNTIKYTTYINVVSVDEKQHSSIYQGLHGNYSSKQSQSSCFCRQEGVHDKYHGFGAAMKIQFQI